jgi:hypothetical protein
MIYWIVINVLNVNLHVIINELEHRILHVFNLLFYSMGGMCLWILIISGYLRKFKKVNIMAMEFRDSRNI